MPRLYTSLLRTIAGPVVVTIAGVTMLWRSWDTWPDPLVDFGIQLYASWQLALGKVLYRDVAYFNGPLSPYLNAALFKVFSVSMRTVEVANLFVLTTIVVMFYRLISRISGRFAATVCGVVFMILFAFAQTGPFGSFNFVCPYTHEVTHGLLLLLAGMSLVGGYQKCERTIYIVAMGACTGLLFLTKAEMFPAIAGPIAALAMTMWQRATPTRRIVKIAGAFLASAMTPILLAIFLLSRAMPFADALRGVLGTWPWVFDSRIRELRFYQWCLGTNDISGNLGWLLAWTAAFVLLFGAAGWIAIKLRRRGNDSIVLAAIGGVVTCAALMYSSIAWSDAARPLPVIMLAAVGFTFVRFRREDSVERDRLALRFGFTLLALALLSKMILNARIWQYGFALAMPATLLMVEAAVDSFPKWIERRGGSGAFVRAIALGAIVAWCVFYVNRFEMLWAQKTFIVGTGGDRFRGDLRGAQVAAVLTSIHDVVDKDESLASLPQGLMLNYLSRRACSSRYAFFNPPEVIAVGETTILGDWQSHPPDWVILDNRAVRNIAFEFFPGDDYGRDIYRWLSSNYRVLAVTKMGEFTIMKRGTKPD